MQLVEYAIVRNREYMCPSDISLCSTEMIQAGLSRDLIYYTTVKVN